MHRHGLQWFTTVTFLLLTPIVAYAAANNSMWSHATSNSMNLQTTQTYTVQPGDTLCGISQKLGVSLSDLIAWNDITNPNLLLPGQSITYTTSSSQREVQSNVQQVGGQSGTSSGIVQPVSTISGPNAGVPASVSGLGKVIDCKLTAYTAGPESTGKVPGDPGYDITASGARAVQGVTVAVDPSVIPLGTKLFIPGVGFRVAQDTGGAIIGDHIDVFYNDLTTAVDFGVRQQVPVYILPNWFPFPAS